MAKTEASRLPVWFKKQPLWVRFAALRFLKPLGMYRDRFYESIDRQDFYRKAFKALAFDGIDGDYVEFGTGAIDVSVGFPGIEKGWL
jgi:hypothetical protein